ncbi:DUF4825 domain-containing protein [Caldalkalibacillus mannanilyticus]|uniref:DUF4825 domain-containing protein n=1 Tax=Caldalkalibacillus mannanilyticus TaxID=1418 RepID=UPI000469D66C|nr:DUF4825 domain-containing protein [Caldalkalibacillus mannanilyticus]
MRTRNAFIIILLSIGVSLFAVLHLFVLPTLAEKEQQYLEEQKDLLTHDVTSVLKYKNKYMGNASNIINLFYTLPLNNLERTYQLYPDVYTLEVNYKENVTEIDSLKLDQTLLYNAIVAFSLIENLEEIHFRFPDVVVKVSREGIEQWVGLTLKEIIDIEAWLKESKRKLEDIEYVRQATEAVLHREINK